MIVNMGAFIGRKIENIRGKPGAACTDNVVLYAAHRASTVQSGGKRSFKTAGATRSMEITTVAASHANHVSGLLLGKPEKNNLEAGDLNPALGPPSGYVIRFSNRLTVHSSGDTRIHADVRTTVRDFHKVNFSGTETGCECAFAGHGGTFDQQAGATGDATGLIFK